MYSVVMLMAMSGTPAMPAHGGRGCHGGGGCYGGGGWSCNGGGCYGGGGWGCNGGCHGGHGCHGGGLFRGRGHGCHGGGWGCHGGGYGCNGGGYGCCGASAGCYGCQGGTVMMSGHAMMVTDAPATIVVNLPLNAKLCFDGALTNATGAARNFSTPALAAGIDHTYTLTAELDGKKITARPVIVRAGQTSTVNLTDADFSSAVAAK